MRRILHVAAAVAISLNLPATVVMAADAQAKTTVSANAASISFNAPLVLRGTLGEDQVQMTLRPKPVAGEGLEGEYFLFGQSQKILLAGETEGSDLFMEESVNGKDVSGHWNATVTGDTISGDWASVGGTVTKHFTLKLVPVGKKSPRHGAIRPPVLSNP